MNARLAPATATLLFALCGVSAPVWAVPVNFELEGTVNVLDDNPFGESFDGLVEIMAMFDDGLISGPGRSVVSFNALGNAFDDGFDAMFSITAGDIVLTQDNDTAAGTGNTVFPTITFLGDGTFGGLSFNATTGTNGSPVDLEIFVDRTNPPFTSNFIRGTGIADGTIDIGSATRTPKAAPVPEPATLALLGAGLLGLVGGRRRKA